LLIASLPTLDRKDAPVGIPGLPPSLLQRRHGCSFRNRCPKAFARCAHDTPTLREVLPDHFVACHLYETVQ
jgi:oligopeptide/dipeptide ABC transporter ATP-binding protein